MRHDEPRFAAPEPLGGFLCSGASEVKCKELESWQSRDSAILKKYLHHDDAKKGVYRFKQLVDALLAGG